MRDAMSDLHFARTFPRTLGPFHMLSCLGQGGFAPVWRAEEVYAGRKIRDVAVKLFYLPNGYQPNSAEAASWIDGVIDEASALCRVEHANVVRFHTLLRDDSHGVVGLVMEYVAGESLGSMFRKYGPMNAAKVLDIGISMAWALSAVHHAGLVHRDVKPDNIIEGSSGYKLVDFGIVAHGSQVSGLAPGSRPSLVGTPGFIPPEYFDLSALAPQWRMASVPDGDRQTQAVASESGLPSSAGDLYSLGVTLFSLATGHLPSEMPGARTIDDADPTNRKLGNALIEFVWLLLEPDPLRRPRFADWVARELETLRASVQPASSANAGLTVLPAKESEVPTSEPRDPQPDTMQFIALQRGNERRDEPHPPNAHPSLVGRHDLLMHIERAAKDARQGKIRIVLVTGPLGIGRTRFLDESLARTGIAKERILRLYGSAERSGPLKPLQASLRALLPGHPFRQLEVTIDRILSPSVLTLGQTTELSLEAIEDALLLAANEGTIILAADDLQWADEYTLKLLQLLIDRADRGARAKLLLLVTVRDEPRASTHLRAFLGALKGRTRDNAKHIALGPLAPSDSALLAQRVCPVENRVENVLVRDCGGVPFFLVNALLAWHETGVIVWRDESYHAVDTTVLEQGIRGVADLLDARLVSFFSPEGPHWRLALRTMAAVGLYGGGLPAEILYDVCGEDDILDDVLDTLKGAGILVVTYEAQEYGFAQEMVRQAALNLVRPKPWFRRIYRKILDALAERPNAEEESVFLAHGYEELGERNAARAWLDKSMVRSLRAGLFTDAMRLGDRLVAITAERKERMDVELAIVRGLVQGRHFDEAKRRLAKLHSNRDFLDKPAGDAAQELKWRILRLEIARGCAESVDDASLVADADALGNLELSCEARIAMAGVAPAEQAMALISAAVNTAQGCHLALEFQARILRFELIHGHGTTYTRRQGDLHQAENDLRRALEIARSTISVWQEVHVDGDIALLEAEMGHTSAAIERLRRLVKQAETLGMSAQRRMFLNNLAAYLMREGRYSEAAVVAEQAADLALDAADLTLHGVSLSLRAYALFCTGDLRGALASINAAELVQRARDDGARGWTLLRRAVILEAMGRADEAIEDARAARANAERYNGTLLLLTAVLWEKLDAARRDSISCDDLQQAVDALATVEIGQRTITRRLVDQATTWLENAVRRRGC